MSHQPSRRRLAAVSVVAATTLLAAAACSSDSSSATASISDLPSAPTGVTLTMWHNAGDSQALLDLYKAYEKESGNTIELVDLPADTYPTAVQTKWATGDRPDILEYMSTAQDIASLNGAENLYDLSSMSFVDAAGDTISGKLDGTTYGAVLGPVSTFGLFYNKDVLKAAGVDVPTSYADLDQICSAITGTGADEVFIGGGSEFPANMFAGFAYMADYNADDQWGQSVASGDTKVNDPDGPIVASFDTIDTLRNDGCLNSSAATATADEAVQAVYDGDAAFTVLPSDFIASFYGLGSSEKSVDAKVGFGPISAEDGIAAYSPGSYGTYYVPKTGDSEKEAAAVDFVNWVTTDGYQQYVDDAKLVPALSTATSPDLTGMYSEMETMLLDPKSTPAFNQSVPGFGNFGKIALQVIAGQTSPQDAADDWQTYVDQAIAAQG
ncbi:ABC transporter substrate-binding protein [Nocardioides sp. GY 10127]|uniref:ABC transporter substrate-binding protein n=1 Tax=Nocardioides sp. GY 10127 TaxID=2569762 RepID=UPI0010A79F14|nr:ABC transporter substrate-binding protein [Nocardioides sp. GY 10127]TIC82755.1 carbohydrate ABC transporter substrate-binding protein [Nocardioides sp. GY 10127]